MKSLPERVSWFRALRRYYKDPSASVFGKLVVFVALIYVVVPIDLIPDVPIVGWLDDIGVMGLATTWLWRVVARYRQIADPSALALDAKSSTLRSDPTTRLGPDGPRAAT
jgi:uncharacterized membrane protein YkvA (DUF1232 family)